mmetsp:Transcript_10724/g.30650  ORF Transcript_10724/g.30650 Transcript_10724/m.30650 type:complete len:223 (-) Transcript_10724:1262-1930(-)
MMMNSMMHWTVVMSSLSAPSPPPTTTTTRCLPQPDLNLSSCTDLHFRHKITIKFPKNRRRLLARRMIKSHQYPRLPRCSDALRQVVPLSKQIAMPLPSLLSTSPWPCPRIGWMNSIPKRRLRTLWPPHRRLNFPVAAMMMMTVVTISQDQVPLLPLRPAHHHLSVLQILVLPKASPWSPAEQQESSSAGPYTRRGSKAHQLPSFPQTWRHRKLQASQRHLSV